MFIYYSGNWQLPSPMNNILCKKTGNKIDPRTSRFILASYLSQQKGHKLMLRGRGGSVLRRGLIPIGETEAREKYFLGEEEKII